MSDKQYLAEHNIPILINNAILALVESRPGNPRRFLMNFIDEQIGEDTGFPDLSKHTNVLSNCLTPEIYNRLKNKRTSFGFTLDAAIQTGVDNPMHPFHTPVGVVAGDEESYSLYAELFNPVIEKLHHLRGGEKYVPDFEWSRLTRSKLDEAYVVSCRVRCVRNLQGFPFPPSINRSQRRAVERIIVEACKSFGGELAGKYVPVSTLTQFEYDGMVKQKTMMDKPFSPLLVSAGIARDWPDARGSFHNDGGTLVVDVNGANHVKLISLFRGGDLQLCFQRYSQGVSSLETYLKRNNHAFAGTDRLGHLATCPSDIGTGLRVSVHVKAPNFGGKSDLFKMFLQKCRLESRGPGGINSAPESGLYDISNLDRVGLTETEIVQRVINGIQKLIDLEKRMQDGLDVTAEVDALPNLE